MNYQKNSFQKSKLALLLIFGPIIAAPIRLAMMSRDPESSFSMGGFYGYAIGSVASVILGIVWFTLGALSERKTESNETQHSQNMAGDAKKAYIVGAAFWCITVGFAVASAFVQSLSTSAVAPIAAGVSFMIGLTAIMVGKGLGDESKQ